MGEPCPVKETRFHHDAFRTYTDMKQSEQPLEPSMHCQLSSQLGESVSSLILRYSTCSDDRRDPPSGEDRRLGGSI